MTPGRPLQRQAEGLCYLGKKETASVKALAVYDELSVEAQAGLLK